ncbi:hypothetical protein Bca4012_065049 [Brassica carinata]|uniref:DUF4283 domain-containing protein n=1 Tax=Brassica carinata TaxID=52824 RepID=A0A8X8AYD9_BRACI|nr:hypothetical protein Bca52824_017504 [Brassica carinata]
MKREGIEFLVPQRSLKEIGYSGKDWNGIDAILWARRGFGLSLGKDIVKGFRILVNIIGFFGDMWFLKRYKICSIRIRSRIPSFWQGESPPPQLLRYDFLCALDFDEIYQLGIRQDMQGEFRIFWFLRSKLHLHINIKIGIWFSVLICILCDTIVIMYQCYSISSLVIKRLICFDSFRVVRILKYLHDYSDIKSLHSGELVYIDFVGTWYYSSQIFSLVCFFIFLTIISSLCSWFLWFKMTQGQWLTKSGGKKCEVSKPCLKITVPRFDNSELIASFDKTLIGRCMNPQKQDMKILLFMLPRIWQVEGRVVGTDLGLGRFQFVFEEEEDITEVLKMEPFHFDYWMVSLVRWKPVLEVNYPSRITFWVRVLDIPLQFWAAQTFRSVGEAIGRIQGEVDLREGRVRVELDGFKPLVFSMAVEFVEGVEIMVSLRYEKLFGFCRECFSMTHDQSRCPTLQKDVGIKDEGVGNQAEPGLQATSYKGAVSNSNRPDDVQRDGQHNRAPVVRDGYKGKGIICERPGPYRQDRTYHEYKERLPRGNGEGSSFRGRQYGYPGRRNALQPRGLQRTGSGEDGHQKLMLDAFKGVNPSPSMVAPKSDGVGRGATPKACKALLFDEGNSAEEKTDEAPVEVQSNDVSELAEVQAQRVPAGMIEQAAKDEENLASQPLDDANLMVEGVILSDSELLVDEESGVVQDQEPGDKIKGDEGQDNKDGVLEKAPKKKSAKSGPLAIGGSMKMRVVQNLLSPRKKNSAKTSAKAGDKGVCCFWLSLGFIFCFCSCPYFRFMVELCYFCGWSMCFVQWFAFADYRCRFLFFFQKDMMVSMAWVGYEVWSWYDPQYLLFVSLVKLEVEKVGYVLLWSQPKSSAVGHGYGRGGKKGIIYDASRKGPGSRWNDSTFLSTILVCNQDGCGFYGQ